MNSCLTTFPAGTILGRKTRHAFSGGRRPGVVILLLCLLGLMQAHHARGEGLDPAEALAVESIIPVLNEDVSLAHRQALELGFRRAVTATLKETSSARGAKEARALQDPEKFVAAYRVLEQERKDLFYRIRILVWVDRRLLASAAGGKEPP